MRTNKDLYWKCSQSAIPAIIPKGTELEVKEGITYIKPSSLENSMVRHDATYYGIRLKDCREKEIPLGYFTK